jgi:U3 small nucleolar RNA-associated protein 4
VLPHLPQRPPLISASKARFLVGWWDRKVFVWKLLQSYREVTTASEPIDLDSNRQLLKTIVIKGESSITSVAINSDGTVLVVATVTEVKAFYLWHDNPTKPSDLRISYITLPKGISSRGATQVRVSPDGQWLCIIQNGSDVSLARILYGDGKLTPGRITVQKPQILSRLDRNIPKYLSQGGFGMYDRRINQVAFSPDSKMLATGDLAGYIDTWVLREQHHLLQNENSADAVDDNASSLSDDPSDGENDLTANLGDRWIRNPRASLLPKLRSSPVVLCFSDDVPESPSSGQTAIEDDNEPKSDYTLLAITTFWNILTFHPLRGTLTPWSRRNQETRLPAQVRNSHDLATGALWKGKRMWIYGISFIFMIDTSQDLPEPKLSKKRKRNAGTGAGGRAKASESANVPDKVVKYGLKSAETLGESRPKALQLDNDDDEDDEDEEMTDAPLTQTTGSELALLRARDRTLHGELIQANQPSTVSPSGPFRCWYIYRDILGIVPLLSSREVSDSSPASPCLEVAVVERPVWDLDQPDTYAA